MKIKFLFLIVFCFFSIGLTGQSTLGGMHGHLIVPDANTFEKNTLIFGTSYYPGKHLYIDRNTRKGRTNSESYTYATVNFVPWMDITFCSARILDVENELNGIGDRSINVKLRISKETKYLPAISIALEVPGGNNNWFASNAILTSKEFGKFTTTIGYGLPFIITRKTTGYIGSADYYASIFGLEILLGSGAKYNEYLNGPLGAVTYEYTWAKIKLRPSLEYDGDKVNGGLVVSRKHFGLSIYAPGLNSFALGVNLNTILQ